MSMDSSNKRVGVAFAPLAERPDAIRQVARWWYDEWGLPQRHESFDAYVGELANLTPENLPFHLLAIGEDRILGVATLKDQSNLQQMFSDFHYWLSGVCISSRLDLILRASTLSISLLASRLRSRREASKEMDKVEYKKGKLMFWKTSFALFALGGGLIVGFALSHSPIFQSAFAQKSGQILVRGHGRAISSIRPSGDQFTFIASNVPERPFKLVPPGMKFVLTDVLYIAQGTVRQDVTVNLADANLDNQTQSILFQVRISPGKSDEVHLCSGYVIPSGHALTAFTNAGIEPEQYISASVTGYLTNE